MNLRLYTLLLLFFLSVSLQAQKVKELYKELLPTVVQIFTAEEGVSPDNPNVKVTMGGLGSGVMIDETGNILTAAHVIQTADEVIVRFEDGEEVPARIIGSSKMADVALIKTYFPPKNKKFAKIGDSDKIEIGDQVMLIGNPLELEFSLSVGYVSGKRRQAEFKNGHPWVEFIQTDASINQGNSGGPMFNMKGEVVGIASFIMTQSGGFEGIGFAASSNVCKELLLSEKGSAWTGMDTEFVTDPLTRVLNIPQDGALLVKKVVLHSPAGVAGIKGGTVPFPMGDDIIMLGGDVILEVNGLKLDDLSQIEKLRDSMLQSEKSQLKILRQGEIIELEIEF